MVRKFNYWLNWIAPLHVTFVALAAVFVATALVLDYVQSRPFSPVELVVVAVAISVYPTWRIRRMRRDRPVPPPPGAGTSAPPDQSPHQT